MLDAQGKAQALFAEIESQNLIRPGVAESKINEDIYALARKMYGITRYWHKRIVRAGRNTLAPYDENTPLSKKLPDGERRLVRLFARS